MKRITSPKNSCIKNIQKLSAKTRERDMQGLFVIEGAREITLAVAGYYLFDSVYICPALFSKTDHPDVLRLIDPSCIYEVNEVIFRKIAYREGSGGILALVRTKPHHLSNLSLPSNPFVIVLEAMEKPGNLGAILRTADAAGVSAVIVCDQQTDIYNPNTIRSSIGCLFTVPVAIGTNEETFAFLKNKHIRIIATELTTSKWYHDMDFTVPSAIIMGTEANGLTEFWLQRANQRIKIPMLGVIDSLNVSAATAVITYEAMRQRGF